MLLLQDKETKAKAGKADEEEEEEEELMDDDEMFKMDDKIVAVLKNMKEKKAADRGMWKL